MRHLIHLDSFRSTLTGSTFKFAAALVNLGILEKVKFDSWQSGMTREGTDQLTIVYELLQLLSANTAAVNEVFSNGIELGMIANFIKGLDLSSINGLITNIPSAVKRAVFPLMARPDTTASELGTYTNTAGDGGVDAFDAFAVDKNVNSLAALDGVYAKAADSDASGEISVADLTPIMSASVGNADVISQTR